MAGRGTDIKLGGNPEMRAMKKCGTQATKEQYEKALAIEKEQWKKDCEEVKNLGGLYVIGSERHESRRIDNQLRGRSGRQGDPGRSKFHISMDDDLMRLFGGEKMKSIMSRIGMEPGEPINHPMLNRSIEKAQKKVEERNFEIRKTLLDFDDVLNQQRKFIYSQRDAILVDENLSQRVTENAMEKVDEIFAMHPTKGKNSSLSALSDTIFQIFGQQIPYDQLTVQGVKDVLLHDIEQKEMLIGKPNLNMFIRYQYIQLIDRKWLDQLEFLDGLREAVHLRGYGQKNPLTEYKIDGFNRFDDMLDEIRDAVASLVFRVKVQVEGQNARREAPKQIVAEHKEAESMSSEANRQQANASPMRTARNPQGGTLVRSMKKIGRNDPCPCGSGKKYKACHGR